MARAFQTGLLLTVRRRGFLFAALIAMAGCGGGGGTIPRLTVPPPIDSCPPVGAPTLLITLPMTQPPAGSTGVSTTIGSITVPLTSQSQQLIGVTLSVFSTAGQQIIGGVFMVSGSSSLTATVPKLQPNTTYTGSATGAPCGPFFTFGQFTTGAP